MKVVSLVGPTGAGKTAVAFTLVQQYLQRYQTAEVHIVSVDSRQVYQGLEIVSGADIPSGYIRVPTAFAYPCFKNGNVYLHGISCIAATEEWSVAHFQHFAWQLVSSLEKRSANLPLLVMFVGGTGLYHASLTQFDPQLQISPNPVLRSRWEAATLADLQAEVRRVDTTAFACMTQSDQQNPRRLVRQLEILLAKQADVVLKDSGVTPPNILKDVAHTSNWVTFGVAAEREQLRAAISNRVVERLNNGAIAEVEHLIKLPQVSSQLLTATGVAEIKAYLAQESTYEELIEKWITREYQYAKRQLTWWRHDDTVTWLTATDTSAWAEVISSL